jgi:DNA-binding MltR family transcriptional regulator
MKRPLPVSEAEFRARSTTFLKELDGESDRGLVLVSAAMLEENLELLLRSVMRADKKTANEVLPDLFRSDGPLGSFAGKTKVAYAMALIDQLMYRDLNRIRAIRNEFAHSYAEAKLTTEGVADRIMELESGKMFEELFSKESDVYFQLDEKGKRSIVVNDKKRRLLIATIVLSAILEGATRAFRDRQAERHPEAT